MYQRQVNNFNGALNKALNFDAPMTMDEYVESVLRNLDQNDSQDRVIFITVGPPGSGKSFLAKKLQERIKDLSVKSLDAYRVLFNNGKYPSTQSEHSKVNKVAIPKYEQEVRKDKARYILLDNTHLRWEPDWQLALQKAKNENYDIFPIMPPLTEFFLFTNRSLHVANGFTNTQTCVCPISSVTNDISVKMSARWFGHRMAHLLNRRICASNLDQIAPLRKDSFTVNNMITVPWGETGILYVLDNYLGYIDQNMARYVVKAANFLRDDAERENLVLRKDSLCHITLINPRKLQDDKLVQIAKHIAQNQNPMTIHYTGINEIESSNGSNSTVFLSISKESQQHWKDLIDLAVKEALPVIPNNKSVFNIDGIHVTLGYQSCDIWKVSKTGEPKWKLTNDMWEALDELYYWKVQDRTI